MNVWSFIAAASVTTLASLAWLAKNRYPVKFGARPLALMGVLVALGTAASMLIIPVGPAKAYPVQHTINVLAAVMLGPVEATLVAMAVGVLRNLLGLGTVLALPGGMIGAFLAGVMYRSLGRQEGAVIGEVFGTGILGALASVPIVRLVLGQEMVALALVVPFGLSSGVGAVIAYVLLRTLSRWIVPTEQGRGP